MMKKGIVWMIMVILIFTSMGCGRKKGTNERNETKIEILQNHTIVYGIVKTENGKGIEGANISFSFDKDGDGYFDPESETEYLKSGKHGIFRIDFSPTQGLSSELRWKVEGEKQGYFKTERTGIISLSQQNIRIDLILPPLVTVPFEGKEKIIPISLEEGKKETISIRFSHPLPKGTRGAVSYVNPMKHPEAFLGELGGKDREGRSTGLLSTGMFQINLYDTEGNDFEPEGNITFEIPCPPSLWAQLYDADPTTEDKIEIPLWRYDFVASRWQEENSKAYLVDAKGIPIPPIRLENINFYPETANKKIRIKGVLPHLSPWNCDYPATMSGISGKIAGDTANAQIRSKRTFTWSIKKGNGRFHLLVPNNISSAKEAAAHLHMIAEKTQTLFQKMEQAKKKSGGEGKCPPLSSFQNIRRMTESMIRKDTLLFAERMDDRTKKSILFYYKLFHTAYEKNDFSNAIKNLRKIQELIPNTDLAREYGGNAAAYFFENSLKDVIDETLNQFSEHLLNITWKQLTPGLTNTYSTLGRCENAFRHTIAAYASSFSNLKDYAREHTKLILTLMHDHHVERAKEGLKNLLQALFKPYHDLLHPGSVLNYNNVMSHLSFATQQILQDPNVQACLALQFKNLSEAMRHQIYKTMRKAESAEKALENTLLLTQILAGTIDLALKEKTYKANMLSLEQWKRFDDDIFSLSLLHHRMNQHIQHLKERGVLTKECADSIGKVAENTLRSSPLLLKRFAQIEKKDSTDPQIEKEGKWLQHIVEMESNLSSLMKENPAIFFPLEQLYSKTLGLITFLQYAKINSRVAGSIKQFNRWVDGMGNEITPPSSATGGGRSLSLLYVSTGGLEIPLQNSDTGIDGKNVQIPRASFFPYNTLKSYKLREIGTFTVEKPVSLLLELKKRDGSTLQLTKKGQWTATLNAGEKRIGIYPIRKFYLPNQMAVDVFARSGWNLELLWEDQAVGSVTLTKEAIKKGNVSIFIDPPLPRLTSLHVTDLEKKGEKVNYHFQILCKSLIPLEKGKFTVSLIDIKKLNGVSLLEEPVSLKLTPLSATQNLWRGRFTYTLEKGGIYFLKFLITLADGREKEQELKIFLPYFSLLQDAYLKSDLNTSQYDYGTCPAITIHLHAKEKEKEIAWVVKGSEELRWAYENNKSDILLWPIFHINDVDRQPQLRIGAILKKGIYSFFTKKTLPFPTVSKRLRYPTLKCTRILQKEENRLISVELEGMWNLFNSPCLRTELIPNEINLTMDDKKVLEYTSPSKGTLVSAIINNPSPGYHRFRAKLMYESLGEWNASLSIYLPDTITIQADKDNRNSLDYNLTIKVEKEGKAIGSLSSIQWSIELQRLKGEEKTSLQHHFTKYGVYPIEVSTLWTSPSGKKIPLLISKTLRVFPQVDVTVTTSNGLPPLTTTFTLRGLDPEFVQDIKWDAIGWSDPEFLKSDRNMSKTFIYKTPGLYFPTAYIYFKDNSIMRLILSEEGIYVFSNLILTASPSSGKVPLEVHFLLKGAENIFKYQWDFNGDGTYDLVTDVPEVSHTYTNIGVYSPTVTIEKEGKILSATTTVTVGGDLSLLFTNGLSPIQNQMFYLFSTHEPFKREGFIKTDNNGRLLLYAPAAIGMVKDGKHSISYYRETGTHTIVLPHLLDRNVTFYFPRNDKYDFASISGSNGKDTFNFADHISVTPLTNQVKKEEKNLFGTFLLQTIIYTNRSLSHVSLRPILANTRIRTFLFPSIELAPQNTEVNLSAYTPLPTAYVEVNTSIGSLSPQASRILVKTKELKQPVSLFLSTGTRQVIPLSNSFEWVKISYALFDQERKFKGFGLLTINHEKIMDWYEDSSSGIHTFHETLFLHQKQISIAKDINVSLFDPLADEWIRSEKEDGNLLFYWMNEIPIRFRLETGTRQAWELTYDPIAIPDKLEADPEGLALETFSLNRDKNGTLFLSVLVDNAQTCTYTLFDSNRSNLSLILHDIPAEITSMRIDRFGDTPWFGENEDNNSSFFVNLRCCNEDQICLLY